MDGCTWLIGVVRWISRLKNMVAGVLTAGHIIKKAAMSKFYWGFSEGKAQWTDFLELLQLLNYEKPSLPHWENVEILLLRRHKFSFPEMFSI